jgi:geranylgeranyl pyrophosphate synthase
VLNLRGFKGNLKARGEDLMQGKCTLPVAKALGRLDRDARRALWEQVAAHPTDPAVVSALVEQLESCGAIAACEREARQLVESAWAAADPVLPDSLYKIMLRAFGWYILERHY